MFGVNLINKIWFEMPSAVRKKLHCKKNDFICAKCIDTSTLTELCDSEKCKLDRILAKHCTQNCKCS